MKRRKVLQYKIISGETVEIYNDKLNDAIRELSDFNPEVKFHETNPMFAFVKYTVTEEIPETIADEYLIKGVRFVCGDCPLLEGADDKRRRYHWCRYRDGIMSSDTACDEFYKMYARGEIFKERSGE